MILITRALDDAVRSKRSLEKLGFEVFIESMFTINYMKRDLDLASYDVVVTTSRNAIRAMSKFTDVRNVRLITVGDRSMECAISLGFKDVFSLNGTVSDLIPYLRERARSMKVLYVRGVEISHNLAQEALRLGMDIKEVIVYEAIAKKEITTPCLDLVKKGKISGVMFYSARTAKIFNGLIRDYSELLCGIRAYVIGEGAAHELNVNEWKEVLVSQRPTEESLFELLLGTNV